MMIDPIAARALIEKALKADPKNARAFYARAAARRASGDYNGADADLVQAVALRPDFADAHLARASLGAAMGKSVEEIKGEFLKSGKMESDFSAYYGDEVAKLAALNPNASSARPAVKPSSGRWVDDLRSLLTFSQNPKRLLPLGFMILAVACLFVYFKRNRD